MKITITIQGGVIQWQEAPEGFKDGVYEVDIKNLDSRTLAQNRSQWLWFTMIANTLNKENLPIAQLIKADVHWTGEKVKNMFFDPVIKALFNVESSTKLKKGDYDLIIDTMTKAFGQRGISLPNFPTQQEKEN